MEGWVDGWMKGWMGKERERQKWRNGDEKGVETDNLNSINQIHFNYMNEWKLINWLHHNLSSSPLP